MRVASEHVVPEEDFWVAFALNAREDELGVIHAAEFGGPAEESGGYFDGSGEGIGDDEAMNLFQLFEVAILQEIADFLLYVR